MYQAKWVVLPVTVFTMMTIAGCTDSPKGSAGSIGKQIGENVTEFAQGVGSGIDQKMQINVELGPEVLNSGLSSTVASQKVDIDKPDKTISVYFIAAKAIRGTLVARAFNSMEQEIGRATSQVEMEEDDAKYVTFEFPVEMDRQTVTVYKISLKLEESQPAAAQ